VNAAAADAETIPYRRILAIVVALILYGSLYPWQFQIRHYAHNPLWILLHAWPTAVDRYLFWDVAINITLYVPLGIFGYLAVSARARQAMRVLAPVAFGLALSASIEMIQLFDDSRMCSLSDLVSNGTGTAVGAAVGAFYRVSLQRFLARHGTASLLRPSGAVLLLSCWLGYQVFPLFPVWGRTNLFRRLAALGTMSAISPVDTLVVFAEWLAVGLLLESIRGRGTNALLALLLLLAPARLILVSRTLAWPDIVGAAAAYAAWLCLPRLWVRRTTPVLLSAALILGELSPFHLQSASAFSWVPFRALFQSTWQEGFVVLFRKSFWYGSVLWLWRASGRSLLWSTAIAAAALFILERVQMVLPGRTPEITDAVLAVLMGLMLWLLRDS
jgi:VanZ family protein